MCQWYANNPDSTIFEFLSVRQFARVLYLWISLLLEPDNHCYSSALLLLQIACVNDGPKLLHHIHYHILLASTRRESGIPLVAKSCDIGYSKPGAIFLLLGYTFATLMRDIQPKDHYSQIDMFSAHNDALNPYKGTLASQ